MKMKSKIKKNKKMKKKKNNDYNDVLYLVL